MDYYRSEVPIVHDNQAHLAIEDKVKPKTGGPLRVEDSDKSQVPKEKDPEMFVGLFSREECDEIMKKRPWVNEMHALIRGWSEKLFEISDEIYSEEKKKIKELNMKKIKK